MIGGALDYRRLAELNRPSDEAGMRAEVLRLANTGLKAIDIAMALHLPLGMVREWLKQ